MPALVPPRSSTSVALDAMSATLEATPYPATAFAPRESFIRFRGAGPERPEGDADAFLDALSDAELGFMVSLVALERAAEASGVDALREAAGDLEDLRASLGNALAAGTHPSLSPLFSAGAPLVVYLKGLFVWCEAVIAALETLALSLRAGRADAAVLRRDLALASVNHFGALAPEIRADLMALRIVDPDSIAAIDAFGDRVDDLLWSSATMREYLDRRFA